MLIDTKIVKRLNFPFCKTNAIYLLVDYMERNEEIQTMQRRIPILIDFMEWLYVHDYRILTQDGLNEYISFLYEKNSFNYAQLICGFIKSFCKYLIDEGFCGYVSFSAKPHKSSDTQDEYDDFNSDTNQEEACEEEEQPKKRRGRPRKTESQEESYEARDDEEKEQPKTESEEQPKKRRGRPRKSENTCQDSNNSQSFNQDADNEEQPKKRRGRPRKSEAKVDTESETDEQFDFSTDEQTEEHPKKRRGRPRKTETYADTESESSEQSEFNTDEQAEEQPKKRRGRPRKSEQSCAQDTNESTTDSQETTGSEKKRRGRPPKGSVPKLKRVTNYYDALGVSPDADIDEIKKVYRKMAMDMHPDLHKDDPLAEKRITSLNMIMAVLKDEVERMVYDVAMGYLEYDERMENVTYKEIKWHTKRYYTVWI